MTKEEFNTAKAQLSFPKRFNTFLPAGFKEMAERMDRDEIKSKMFEYQQSIAQTEADMEADPKLNELKERVKDASFDYKSVINENKAMIRYLLYVLDGRGV